MAAWALSGIGEWGMRTLWVGLIVVLFLGLSGPALAAEETVVFEIVGNGQRNTRPFMVKDRWELRWDLRGQTLGITIRDPDGKFVAAGGQQDKQGQGASYQPKGGSYFLEITGVGDWTITVVQLP